MGPRALVGKKASSTGCRGGSELLESSAVQWAALGGTCLPMGLQRPPQAAGLFQWPLSGTRNVACTQNIGFCNASRLAKLFCLISPPQIREQDGCWAGRRRIGAVDLTQRGGKKGFVKAARPPGSMCCKAPRNSLAMLSRSSIQHGVLKAESTVRARRLSGREGGCSAAGRLLQGHARAASHRRWCSQVWRPACKERWPGRSRKSSNSSKMWKK